MAPENFSIGAFYNITKNQDNNNNNNPICKAPECQKTSVAPNPIKTVGRDSFLSPKPLKIQVF